MERQEPLIPRPSAEIRLRVGERAITLTYLNAEVFLFSEPYEMMNHVYYFPGGDENNCYFFDSENLIDQLAEQDYPINSRPWPSDADVLAYERYQSQLLAKELEEL